jgi:hypothetical protein
MKIVYGVFTWHVQVLLASNKVICKVKEMKLWVCPKPRVYENQHKATQVYLMLKLSYTKSGVMLLKFDFLACAILGWVGGRQRC